MKESTSLSVVHRLAILYLMLPVVIWLVGWFHWWLGIPAALLIVFALGRPTLPSWKVSSWRVSLTPATGVLLLIALAWVMATAAGGVFDINNYNWDRNRAILLHLSRDDWPVYFTTYFDLPLLLRYYLGYYMVPGLLGKWFGVAALNWAVPLWTWCGAALALLLFTRACRGWWVLAAVPILIFFGMWDHLLPNLEIAGYRYQLRHIAVSPQHFIPGVLFALLLIQLRRHAQFLPLSGVVIAACIFWSPFIAIGLLPLVGVLILQIGVRSFLGWQNLLVAPPFALLLLMYVSSGSAHYPRGWVWETRGWGYLLDSGGAVMIVNFLVLALLLMLLRPHLRRDPLFLICLVVFPVSLFYTYGYDADWLRHVPLPALVVLSFYAAEAVVGRWGDYREWRHRSALGLIVIVIAVGSVTPTVLYLSDAFASRDLRVLRYERIDRHATIFTAVESHFIDNNVVPVTAWQELLLRDDPPETLPDKGDLIIDADYAVYLKDKRLVYIQRDCNREEVESRFILHIIPVDKAILEGREHHNEDFFFAWNGMRIAGTCIVVRDLPAYEIATITTGQYIGGANPTGHKWLAAFEMPRL